MMEIGMVTAIAAAAMFFWYRPRWGEGAKLCALCFVMGLAGMFMGGCGPLLAMVAGVCCLFSLHREKLARLRAQKRRAHQKAQPAPAQADRAAASDRAPLLTVLYGGEPRGRGCA